MTKKKRTLYKLFRGARWTRLTTRTGLLVSLLTGCKVACFFAALMIMFPLMLVIGYALMHFSATRSFAEWERLLTSSSASVAMTGLRVTS